jgi:hypothetical protein
MGLFEAVMRLVRGEGADDDRTGEASGTEAATATAPVSVEFADEEAAEEFACQAEEFAGAWPGYDLDFSPGSLEQLDTIAEEEYQRVTRAADVEEAAVVTESHGFASYFGEVIRRNHDAGWVADEEYTVSVADGTRPTGVDAMEVAVACLATSTTFAGTYRQLVG